MVGANTLDVGSWTQDISLDNFKLKGSNPAGLSELYVLNIFEENEGRVSFIDTGGVSGRMMVVSNLRKIELVVMLTARAMEERVLWSSL